MENKHCLGCGVELQDTNIMQEGYTNSIENDYCRRCFRIKNYGSYQVSTKSNEEYIEILKSIGETNDLVVYVVDVLNINKNIEFIRQYIDNKMILVLNKRDLLPKHTNEAKIIQYIKEQLDGNYEDIIFISANKNYHIDELYQLMKKQKTSKNIYLIGNTNTGKSSLINSLLNSYSENDGDLTISPLPSTTLSKIEIDFTDDITLIDTPGLVDRGNLTNYVDVSMLKKLSPRKEIKPRTYQLRKNQCLIIGNLLRIDYIEGDRNSFTLYLSNDIKVKRMNALKHENLKELYKTTYELKYYEDIVINGLGWIKVVDRGTVDIYIDKNVETFTRRNLI